MHKMSTFVVLTTRQALPCRPMSFAIEQNPTIEHHLS
jgi:hypothetical protein